jgi:hypothetical protein
MLHQKEHIHLEQNHSKNFHFGTCRKENPAEKYGATSMFGSPGSSSAINTLFHHIPDITKPNQCPVCKCRPANRTHPLSRHFSGHARGCTCPYQRTSSSPSLTRETILAFLEHSAEPALLFGQFLLRCPDCPHPQAYKISLHRFLFLPVCNYQRRVLKCRIMSITQPSFF